MTYDSGWWKSLSKGMTYRVWKRTIRVGENTVHLHVWDRAHGCHAWEVISLWATSCGGNGLIAEGDSERDHILTEQSAKSAATRAAKKFLGV